ncbi:uncharacterized protein isoform X1 [Choristoneura fumiferana]|uniref:uncharacterized protein isoform X1 n=1 Tax=Choristoneura fumiferana TaxID=7141 RepID=UPI003D1550A8
MLGARLKSWMEAQLGRAKKRKQKQSRQSATATSSSGPLPPPHLSSPESAYSTGYSTDGTSPGAPPAPLAAPLVAPPPPPAPPTTHLYHEPAKRRSSVGVKRALPEPPIVCMTPSPRPRCRIRTNPWLGSTSPNPRRRPHLLQQQSLQCPPPPPLVHAPYSLDSHPARFNRSPHLSPHISPQPRTPYRGASSDEECRGMRTRGRETAILSDADIDSDGDTGLDGGDEDEPDDTASPGRRRARRRRPPRRPPRSAGATPPRARRRHVPAPAAPPVRERDPLLEADREAERKYRELIREAEKLLVTVSRAPLEPPHNPRVRELRATEVEAPRRSPERTHITNFMRANSPEPPRRLSPVARRSPLAAPPPPARTLPPSTERPHSEPPKRKAYARDEVLQTLEGLRKSLQQQSALLAVQRTRLDSL